jgi:YfiH family protein
VLTCDALGGLATHVFTTRQLSFRGRSTDHDYRRLAAVLGVDATSIVRVRQIHGRDVILVRPGEALPDSAGADAILSLDPARPIAIRIADCVPVLVADRRGRVVGAAHAGWRGTCAGVASALVEAIDKAGVPASDLVAAVGPSIGPCCYQIDGRVRDAFLSADPLASDWFADDGAGRWKLDLWRANATQLVRSGIPRSAIHAARYCTADHLADCFSYRKEGAETGRLVAAIRLSPA